jgi:phytoene dehydrogenase-like protein
MPDKSIIIIGAGMGGLAAGVYAQANGYRTQIFEMHTVPGGQCAAWKRKGYTFDGCIHHLFGCGPHSRLNRFWTELGAMPRELVPTQDCVSVASPEETLFTDYWDLDRLKAHLRELSPADSAVIDDYIDGIRAFARHDMWGALMLGTLADKVGLVPGLPSMMKWFKPTMRQFAGRLSDPFLKRAFPLLEYSLPDAPWMLHLVKHAYGLQSDIAWPVGGALGFARSIAQRYTDLGGVVHYGQKVEKILTESDAAVGVRLADGSEHRADIVISNADGRKTIVNMLDNRYADERIRRYCGEPPDETNWAVHVFLGVDRDLSAEPSALLMLFDQPVTIANHTTDHLEMQLYGHDHTMAPAGKGVIKVELVSTYSYWKGLYADRSRYDEEKQKTADTVITLLERHFPGLKSQVEAIDVPTLVTWERYMGGSHGFLTGPNKKPDIMGTLLGRGLETTLPGLAGFYMVGSWASSGGGALFINALSGKTVVKSICRMDDKRFLTPLL